MDRVGAIIDEGPQDWAIAQQDEDGLGTFELRGRWRLAAAAAEESTPPWVEVRVVLESTGAPVVEWSAAEGAAGSAAEEGTWRATVRAPAGGLYRLETRLRLASQPAAEWSPRGDMRHFLGVGDVWVVTGQSNSAGYGRGPYEDPPELLVHAFSNSENWALASHPLNESTDTKHPVNREGANPGHSPYLQFGRLLSRQLGYPIGLVATCALPNPNLAKPDASCVALTRRATAALGGSPLTAWDPTDGSEAGLYDNMVSCVAAAGVPKPKGVLWYQVPKTELGAEVRAAPF
eukprot:COSAG04_NODE_1424_length_6819_cov_3.386905_5_plen_290_part_00